MKKEQRQALTNAMYLKCNNWDFDIEDGREGWRDPQNNAHYFEMEALTIQLLRDESKFKPFKREPRAF